MTIDWVSFTPWAALSGGLLIGSAAAVFLLFNGRIAGISGVIGGLLKPSAGGIGWRIAFAAGLLAAPVLYRASVGMPDIRIDAGTPLLIAAGLIVGIGTRYGSGCTSGHGVCGLSRLSTRSMVAVPVFMMAGFATVYVVRHLLPLSGA